MKFSKLSQLFLVSTLGLLVATLLTACQLVTIDYVFVACSASSTAGSAGQIETYAVDGQSGALRQVNKVVPSGGSGPAALAVSADYNNLYVANQGNKSVVHFAIAIDGTLTQKDTVTLATAPVALAVSSTNKYLYVVSGTSSATLTEYSLGSDGTIGSSAAQQTLTLSGYAGDVLVPTAVATLANGSAVYVAAYDQSAYNPGGSVTSNANPGWVFGFNVGSGGALTVTSSSPYQAGVRPSSLTADPTSRFVYATDYASNSIVGYTIASGNQLNFMVSGPYKTGSQPSAIVVDPRGFYIYVPNSLQNTVSSYAITLATGAPTVVVSGKTATTNATDTQPVAIVVDPALGRYVYTANYVGNSISGFRLVPNTGELSATQATPYPTGANPVALAVVPHGNHAVQTVSP